MVDPRQIDPAALAEAMGFRTDAPEKGHHLRALIPQYSRVQVPLDNVIKLRDYADMLRGLASQLDFISRRPDLSDAQALYFAKGEVLSTQRKILHIWKSDKSE